MEGILKNLTLFKEGCVFYLFFIEVVDLQCSVNFTVQKVIYIYFFFFNGFSSSHVWMWELDYKESWALKNWCFWTVVLEKTLESPLDCKEIQPVHPKGISPECSLEGLMLNWNSNTLATWCKELTHLTRPWCWERLQARGEGDNREWYGL